MVESQVPTSASVEKISKDIGPIFFGLSAGLVFAFFGRVLLARVWSVDDYGIFSQAFAVLNIAVVIATLGLQQGASRSIAYALAGEGQDKARRIVSAAIRLALGASLIIGIALFLVSGPVAGSIFDEPKLVTPLKIFAVAVPFFTLINVLAAVFLGFGNTSARIYFQDILRNALFPVFLVLLAVLSLPFVGVFYANLVGLCITCCWLVLYTRRRLPGMASLTAGIRDATVFREILLFSLPLLGIAVVDLAMGLLDTVILGYYKSSAEVGLYNAAYPLCILISAPATALALIYLPVSSGLFARRRLAEMKTIYVIITKWLGFVTLPLFFILFLFPDITLTLIFGAEYTGAATALRILSLGFIINNLVGPNGATLIAIGKPQFVMWTSLLALALNIALNLILIPGLGMAGAAIAFAASMASLNLVKAWKLYSVQRIAPWSLNLLKPVPAFLLMLLAVYFLMMPLTISAWFYVPVFVLYYAACGTAVVVTKSLHRQDIDILVEIVNTGWLKGIIRRFL